MTSPTNPQPMPPAGLSPEQLSRPMEVVYAVERELTAATRRAEEAERERERERDEARACVDDILGDMPNPHAARREAGITCHHLPRLTIGSENGYICCECWAIETEKKLAEAQTDLEKISECFEDDAPHKHEQTGVSLVDDVRDHFKSFFGYLRQLDAYRKKDAQLEAELSTLRATLRQVQAERDEARAQRDEALSQLKTLGEELEEATVGQVIAENQATDLRTALAEKERQTTPDFTYVSTQATECAGCGIRKHTPLRRDEMGGYVCLTCIDKALSEAVRIPKNLSSWTTDFLPHGDPGIPSTMQEAFDTMEKSERPCEIVIRTHPLPAPPAIGGEKS